VSLVEVDGVQVGVQELEREHGLEVEWVALSVQVLAGICF